MLLCKTGPVTMNKSDQAQGASTDSSFLSCQCYAHGGYASFWTIIQVCCRCWMRRLMREAPHANQRSSPLCQEKLGLELNRMVQLPRSHRLGAQQHPCSPHSHPQSPRLCQPALCQKRQMLHASQVVTGRQSKQLMRHLQPASMPRQAPVQIPQLVKMLRQRCMSVA